MPIGFKAKLFLSFQKLLLSFCISSTPDIHPVLFKITSTHCISRVSYIATPVSTEQAQAPSKLAWKGLRTGYSKSQGSCIYSSQDGETRVHFCILKAQDTDWDKKRYSCMDSNYTFHWVPGQITYPAINLLRQYTSNDVGTQERFDTATVDTFKKWMCMSCNAAKKCCQNC